jgi:hypothetical protein
VLVDPLTAPALAATITAVLNSAAGEAGKAAWTRLSTAAGRLLRSASSEADTLAEAGTLAEVDQAVIAPQAHDLPEAATQAAETLLTLAQQDPDFAELLAAWQAEAVMTNNYTSTVLNTVTGQVNGPVVQLHTNHGGITF